MTPSVVDGHLNGNTNGVAGDDEQVLHVTTNGVLSGSPRSCSSTETRTRQPRPPRPRRRMRSAKDPKCEFPDAGYDCDGNCLNDTDGDGVGRLEVADVRMHLPATTTQMHRRRRLVPTRRAAYAAEMALPTALATVKGTLDECGVCGGDGIADGACDCDGNVLDECGVCGGTALPTACDLRRQRPEAGYDCDGNCLR